VAFTAWLAEDLVLTAIVLWWAKRATLDLGLRAPALRGIWLWLALYILWYAAEWAIFALYPPEDDPEWLDRLQRLPLPAELVLTVVTGPLFEELLFRGAMFSALLRRWGIRAAALVPSLLWGLIHIGYEPWFIASIAGSGVVLAVIRWRSGSLYLPLCLHAAGNLIVTLHADGRLAGPV
jgi:membrane protease YdiL (CAAX protease family)